MKTFATPVTQVSSYPPISRMHSLSGSRLCLVPRLGKMAIGGISAGFFGSKMIQAASQRNVPGAAFSYLGAAASGFYAAFQGWQAFDMAADVTVARHQQVVRPDLYLERVLEHQRPQT